MAKQNKVLETAQPSLGEKCQRTRPTEEEQARLQGLDLDEASRIAAHFDKLLSGFESYGGAYWHEDGGIRVRIANDRTDAVSATEAADDLMATSNARSVGGISVEPTGTTYQDLRNWVDDAYSGLTYIPKEAIKSVSTNLLCQYVIIYVAQPDGIRLSEEEPTRYDVTTPAVRDDHSRDTDQEPYYGGVRMKDTENGADDVDNISCTAGFTMLRNNVRYLSTAGHCSYTDNFWTTRYVDYIGWDALNPYEDDTTAHDVMLIRGQTYHSPIWYGPWNTSGRRYVTNKFIDGPGVGHVVYMSGGRSGLQGAVVSDGYDPESPCSGTVQATFYVGNYAQAGDSGAPWSSDNTATIRSDDVKAAGIHNCSDDPSTDDTYAWFTRIGKVEDWTGSTVVMSSP